MKTSPLHFWRERIAERGLTNLVGLCLDVMEPFSPFAAQALWVMQPTLGLFMDRQRVSDWATLLEDPQSMNWLREQLIVDVNDD